jgi:hypothetical protein
MGMEQQPGMLGIQTLDGSLGIDAVRTCLGPEEPQMNLRPATGVRGYPGRGTGPRSSARGQKEKHE